MKLKTKFSVGILTLALAGVCLAGCGETPTPPAPVPPTPTIYYVTVKPSGSTDFTVTGIDGEGYEKGSTVEFTVTVNNPEKEIAKVEANSTTLTPVGGKYSFTISRDTDVYVTLQTKAVWNLADITVAEDATVATSLTFGGIVQTGYTVVILTGEERISVSGTSVTGVLAGSATIAAIVNSEQVATANVTVTKTIRTIGEAIEDARTNKTGFSDNSKDTKTDTQYKLKGQVATKGTLYNGYVEVIIDDGTGAVCLSVKSSSNIPDTTFAVGDWVEVNEKLQNYKGVIECSISSTNYITKIEHDPITLTFPAMTGAQYDAHIASFNANEFSFPSKAKVTVTAEEGTTRFLVKDSSKYNGKIATSKSNPAPEHFDEATYIFEGYLFSENASSSYMNYVVCTQTKQTAESVTLDEDSLDMKLNNTHQLTYVVTPAGAGNTVTWESDNEDVATVDGNGVVTAIGAGTATITLTVDEVSDTCEVSVTSQLEPATSATVTPNPATVNKGTTKQLTAIPNPLDTTDVAVWTSQDESICTVDQTGLIRGIASGNTTVTVTYNEDVSVVVPVTVTNIHINDITESGLPLDLDATIVHIDENNVYVDDGTAGTLVRALNVEGLAVGDHVNVSGISDTISSYNSGTSIQIIGSRDGTVTVNAQVTKLEGQGPTPTTAVAKTEDELKTIKGDGKTFIKPMEKVSFRMTSVASKSGNYLTWNVGTVQMENTLNSGLDAIEVGKVYDVEGYIQGVYNSTYLLCVVTKATKVTVPLETITFAEPTYEVGVNETLTLDPIAGPAGAEITDPAWSSSDTTVATVTDGVVTGVKSGTVTITVTSNGITGSTTVVVKDASEIPTIYKQSNFIPANNSKGESQYTNAWSNTTNGFQVDLQNISNNNNGDGGATRLGRKNDASVATVTTNAKIDLAVTKVVVNYTQFNNINKINSVKVEVSSDGEHWTVVGDLPMASGEQSLTIPVSSRGTNLYYRIVWDCNATGSNGNIRFNRIDFYAVVPQA